MNIKIIPNSVIVLVGHGTDKISFDLQYSTTFPNSDGIPSLTIETQRGYAVKWLNKELGINNPKVINTTIKSMKFVRK